MRIHKDKRSGLVKRAALCFFLGMTSSFIVVAEPEQAQQPGFDLLELRLALGN